MANQAFSGIEECGQAEKIQRCLEPVPTEMTENGQADHRAAGSNQGAVGSCPVFDAKYRIPQNERLTKKGASQRLRGYFCKRSPLQLLLKYLPLISTLRHYDVKKNLASDIVSGLSVSVLHTGQGLGYAALAGLPPVYGIYVSFFHVAVYSFLGTSNHISVGTYSLTSLLVGAVLDREVAVATGTGLSGCTEGLPFNSSAQSQVNEYRVGIATTLSFLVGVMLILLGIFRFGVIIANYISPAFISAFTCASAFHIASSQLKYAAFGRHHYIGNYAGPLKLYYLWRDFFVNFLEINWMCSICFLVSLAILFAVKVGINKNPRFRHRLFMPVPVDLFVIILFTVLSYLFTFENIPDVESGVEVVGPMPVGLLPPSIPSFCKWSSFLADAFILSILIFLFNYTMANFFKEKYKYNINENQEMLAAGIYHLISAFFSCFPGSASPPRCFMQDAAGCKTQLSSLISCVVLILVLYVLGPYLYYLPFAVIAALICVSLKRLMLQFRDLKPLWSEDKIDFAVWIVTFLATFILDIQLGMMVGIGFHVFMVVVRLQLNSVYSVGIVDAVYDDVTKYRVSSRPDIVVLRYNSPLLFVNCDRFKKMVIKAVNSVTLLEGGNKDARSPATLAAVILDCTYVGLIDTAAAKSLVKVQATLMEQGFNLHFAGCSPRFRKTLNAAAPALYNLAFLTIDDAALHVLGTAERIREEKTEL